MMHARHFQILISHNLPTLPDSVLIIGESGIPFSQTANLLGQEFAHILFDARAGIHLEALAIAAGTLKQDGTFVLLLSQWASLAEQPDRDSLRWNGTLLPIATPYFIAHFQRLVKYYDFPILSHQSAVDFPDVFSAPALKQTTIAQQQIIHQILQEKSDCYFLTAKRGRGKSALLGCLANQINAPILLTAPNKSAVKTLLEFAERDIAFIAPDELVQRLQSDPLFSRNAWLLVDEAAMIPLPLLQTFAQHFHHIVFSTTIHSYEGTGRGFELKFKQKIHRTFAHFELTQPLRWQENDPLEGFIDDLLLLNAEDDFAQTPYTPAPYQQREVTQTALAQNPQNFYGLLTLAHYRTSPIDLRRLFDGQHQRFYVAEYGEHLLGGIWALEEGTMADLELIQQIQRGQRRPKGNLVPQALCFHANLPEACQLRSLRISRIAVQPHWQRRGIGQGLIDFMAAHSDVDFLSVSFGYTPQLAHFWQQCGFHIVQLGEHQEASSGCYSAIALKGISAAGITLVETARSQFLRNINLTFHPQRESFPTAPIDWTLNDTDWLDLKNFADFHRTLYATIPAIRRLIYHFGAEKMPLNADYLIKKQLPVNKKKSVEYLRLEIKRFLQKELKNECGNETQPKLV